MSTLAERIAALSPEQRRHFERSLAREAVDVSRLGIVPRAADGPAPASFAQRRLWFLDRMAPGGSGYAMPGAVRLRGRLDAAALERALAEVVRRHASLRTVFREVEGEPVQVAVPATAFALPAIDLTYVYLSTASARAEAERRARDEAARPFDLARGPLFRAVLYRVGLDEHLLAWTAHHAVFDGASAGLMLGEVAVLYAAFAAGEASPLAEPAVQYADFAAWQRERLTDDVVARETAWWRERLDGAPALLDLPTDRPRPAVQDYAGASEPVRVSAAASDALRALARSEGATPYMALLAAFQLLLGRYAGVDDIVVGSPVSGRGRRELQGMIGLLVDTVVVRGDLSGDLPFAAFLGRVREAVLDARNHASIPFEKLVEALAPERSLGHNPIFQALFNFQDASGGSMAFGGCTVEGVVLDLGVAKFDLTLSLADSPDGMAGVLEYRTDLFEPATVRRMADAFQALVEGIAADPTLPLSALPLLDGETRRTVLEDWSRGPSAGSADETLHGLFARQAARTPDAVALLHEGETWTYAALDRASRRVAAFLRARGIGAETAVGVCAGRSPALAAALLGTMRAGAVYLPLDPASPADRLAWIARDAGAALVLASAAARASVADAGIEIVDLDSLVRIDGPVETDHSDDTDAGIHPEALAYVIYTSGSTGTPKGVAVAHGQAARHARAVAEAHGLTANDGVLQFAAPSFDPSLEQCFSAWAAGAKVVMRGEELWTAEELGRRIREAGVTVANLPTRLFGVWAGWLAEHPAEAAGLPLRVVMPGGEAFGADALASWRRAGLPGVRVLNAYGPTESVVTATMHVVGDDEEVHGPHVPIGRPLAGRRAYLLDAAIRPVPAGARGELCLGGVLARGYLGRPAMTAERFVPDPFSGEPGARLYCTGDLARWREVRECESAKVRERAPGQDSRAVAPTFALSDSRTFALEFAGRVDDQVKVRGFRVEPGEVEAVLARHTAAAEVVVTVRREGGEPRLVAYAEPIVGLALDAEAIGAFARAHLPGYMVPADVVVLDALPRTPGGKVDRQRLPAPAAASASAPSDAPRTAVEEIVAGVWVSVLGGGTPGREDGFFARGGHSLSALQLLARLRDVLGVEVSVRALFEAPTVAGLARAVDEARRGDAPAAPPLVAAAHEGAIPLSFAQQRLWLLQQLEPGSAVYNLPLEMEIPASLTDAEVDAALTGLVARHAVLRTTFAAGEDGGGVQVIHPPVPFRADHADFTGLAHDARWTAVRSFTRDAVETAVDLADGPVLRAVRVRLGESADRLLLVMHHAAADGITAGILGEDLAALLDAAAEGRDAVLPALPVQYADYARWQRDWLRDEVEASQAAWWKTRLAGAPPVSPLPTDRPRPVTQSYRGETRTLALPAEVAEGVRRLSREASGTVFMTLLAAFKVLLQRWGVGDDVVVGTHVAGRARVETERVAGFFVNALVLRTDLSGIPAFREVVARVRETMLGALAHQDLPFERVVEALQPRRDLSVSPLYQLSFDLARVETALGDGDDAAERLLEGAPTTKFDLEVTVEDRPDALRVHFGYATDLFNGDTIERMLGHYAALLAAAVEDASIAAADLPMLGADELRLLTEEFQGPARAYRTDRTLAELFEEQAASTPDRIAAVHDGRSVTYAEMDRRAGVLARRLAAAGVGRGRFVGILDERGIDFITAVVAVLKAGGAYLPIDPGYPAGRVRHMLADSGVAHLVTRGSIAQAHAEALEAAPALRHVVLLDDAAAWEGVEPLACYAGSPRDPAYMLYTSGSTGLPKGAVIRNDGAVNHVFAQVDVLSLGAEWAFLQSAPASSDISVWQMLGPLLVGGRSVVADAETVSDPARLLAVLQGDGITVAELVPAVLRGLLAHVDTLPAEALALPALGWMMATGEEVPVDLVNAWLAAYPSTPLTNAYGPTEASDDVTQLVVERPLPDDARAVSIGRPLPNVACHVIDGRMRAAPLGAPGELCVGGIAVGDGYHGKPGRTAGAFVPDPFSATPGATMYRTGDLARWRPDGTLEFLGRIDGQVKVRGFRIETGEVEAALRAHPTVRDCAVVVRDGAAGRHLAAAIVASDGDESSVDAAALRAWLRERLPEPMVPAAFAVMDALPLTPAGKVDRRALAAASFDGAAAADEFVAPRTPTETALAAIWAEVLGMERVGVESDFFALGGHSLLAAMVATRVRAALGVPLPLRRMFEHTTIARLAAHLDQARTDAPAPAARPALARVERSGRRVAGAADGFLKTVQ